MNKLQKLIEIAIDREAKELGLILTAKERKLMVFAAVLGAQVIVETPPSEFRNDNEPVLYNWMEPK